MKTHLIKYRIFILSLLICLTCKNKLICKDNAKEKQSKKKYLLEKNSHTDKKRNLDNRRKLSKKNAELREKYKDYMTSTKSASKDYGF